MHRTGHLLRALFVLTLLGGLDRATDGDTPQLPSAPTAPTSSPNSLPRLFEQDTLLGNVGGERARLEDEGFSLRPIYSAETFGNPTGGAKQGVVYEGLLDVELNLDFKKMADWDGAFHGSFYYPMGNSLTDEDTHDLFRVSNIDAYDTPHLFELWYEQKFLDDKVGLRFGQLSADAEFAISSGSQNFLNSTYGWPAVLASDAPSPQFPYAAPGVRLSVAPDEHWTFLGAVFAGNPAPDRIGDPNPNRAPDSQYDNSGTDFAINGGDGLYSIDELSYKLNQEEKATGLPGTYKIGGWMQTGTFSNLRYDEHGVPLASPASDGHPQAVDGNYGFYVVLDQAIWQDNSDPKQPQNVSLFFRGGTGEGDRSLFDYYCDGGIVFNGLIPGRPSDLVGIATAYGSIGQALTGHAQDENSYQGTNQPVADFEQNIELTYFAEVAKWWTVQPDIQFLRHPGGSSAIPDAVVLGVRTVVTF